MIIEHCDINLRDKIIKDIKRGPIEERILLDILK